ncbi:hypothetical protein [Streptomyces sp. NPDC127098]|uniref:hypothetical protein n=1 Tax=Streptomyces sp. NPDC127098 TaxID=3347137 RepID=UPI00364941C4
MSTHPASPHLKSIPHTDRPTVAEPTPATTDRGRLEDRRPKAVPSGSGTQRRDGRRPVAWLHVFAPPNWQVVPTARSWCECGRDERAVGRRKVLALIAEHNTHRDACPLRTAKENAA